MTELEIKKATELLILEDSRQTIAKEIGRLQDTLERFDNMIELVNKDPEWYFEVQARIKELFPEDSPTASTYKL